MKPKLSAKIKELFGIQKNWKELNREILLDLGINQKYRENWKPLFITKVDNKSNLISLQDENGVLFNVKSDNFTLRNLNRAISETKFKHIFGGNYQYEIWQWTYSYSKIKPPNFHFVLRTKLNKENQTSRKRKRMYHKSKIDCTNFFIKNLIHNKIVD